jgi:phage portal protein BeeE
VDLLDRVAAARGGGSAVAKRSSIDQWLTEYLLPAMGQFTYGGNTYPYGLMQTLANNRVEEISQTLPGFSAALRSCPPAFAAQMVRAMVLSQARFTFRNLPWTATPRRTFGNRDLGVLERPWPNATTGELLARAEWHAGLAGNAYVTNRQRGRLRVLRPDWVTVIYGSEQEPEDAAHALDGELLGYSYVNGGPLANRNRPQVLLPEECAHWSPLPDPERAGIGMSWITPAVREIQGDQLATQHKIKFFENGATANLVVKGIPATTKAQFDDIVDMLESRHAGVANAYRTLYLTAGADATVVGSDLKQIDFKATQGAGETRIAALSRVPAPLLGISEGLAGSSLNAGNFGMARRIFADSWIYPTLQDVSAAFAPLVDVPADAELWFDTADMPLLREDAKDAAEIEGIKAATIRQLVDGGFEAPSVIAAVQGQNMSLLVHSGMLSVQLQAPGTTSENARCIVRDFDAMARLIEQGWTVSGVEADAPAQLNGSTPNALVG